MPFSRIIGHRKQADILRRALGEARLHHAYLFLGPDGVGKKTVALSLAKAIHCLERAPDFCDSCANCVRIANGNHPDVRLVEPAAKKKEIVIDQIRELERQLSFRTFSGRKKIAILDPASSMNLVAQNALLKTLEEPPGDSLLILVSPGTGGLLPTVVSRCLRLSFGPLPPQQVTDFLTSQNKMNPDRAEIIAALAMGSLGKALSAEMEPLLTRRTEWLDKISSIDGADCREWLAFAEEVAGTREDAVTFLEWLAIWYRDIVVCSAAGAGAAITNRDMMASIEEWSRRHGVDKLLAVLAEVSRTDRRIRRNFNRRMLLETLFSRVAELR